MRARVLQILSELVSLWIQGEDIFLGPDAWFTWATLLGWLFFVGVWLYRMNEALSLCVRAREIELTAKCTRDHATSCARRRYLQL